MSIASEITRISQNVSDSLDAVAAKGVTVPSGSTSDDLPDLISAIQTNPYKDINFIDYDGTIIESFTKTEWDTRYAKNLWDNDDITITDTTSGLIQALLKTPLEAGTYILSCIAVSDNPNTTYSKFRFSTSQNADALPSSSFKGDGNIVHDGIRRSVTITITEKVYSFRIFSASNTITSAGYGGTYTDIQIEKGSTATEYYKMPNIPDHSGDTVPFISQTWNWSLLDAKRYVAEYGKLTITPIPISGSN